MSVRLQVQSILGYFASDLCEGFFFPFFLSKIFCENY
jgi:hypothetical protein